MNFSDFSGERSAKKRVLIADSVKNANRLVRKSGRILFNTEIKTISDIAAETIASEFAREGKIKSVNILGKKACAHILSGVLSEFRPDFLPVSCLDINSAAEILDILNKIRLSEPTEVYKDGKTDKIQQIKELISRYETVLSANDAFDLPLLLKRAEEIGRFPDFIYYALESESRSAAEKAFVQRLTQGRPVITYMGKELTKNIDFKLAYGIENEVMQAADSIADKNYGECAVYYTSNEYANMIQAVFESRGIPCRITSGVSASQTNVVSFMLNILSWAKSEYLYKALKSVMSSPIIRLDTDPPSPVYKQYTSALDKAIVWGLDNYGPWLDQKEEQAKNYTSEYKTEDEIETERMCRLAFIKLMRALIKVFEENCTVCELFSKLFEFTKANTKFNDINKISYQRIYTAAEELRFYTNGSMEQNINTLYDFLSELKINSSERTDSVLAAQLTAPEVMERKYNFFLGLSALQFNSALSESPVLSDSEIEEWLADEDLLSSKVNEIKRRDFLNTLRSAREDAEITLSSMIYDTVKMQPATPAPIYNELLVYCGREMPKDYRTYPKNTDKNVRVTAAGWETFPDAQKARNFDRNFKQAQNISPSGLQSLLECPQRFFFHNVLLLREEEFKERDAGAWLDTASSGIYCHSVLEEYINTVKNNIENFDENVFNETFNKVFSQAETDVYCDVKQVRETKKQDIYNKLKKYVKNMHEEFKSSGFYPVDCEHNFKDVEALISEDGWSGKLTFNGTIDRIDKNADGEYRVIDYKTGTYKEDENDTYKQHIVYPLAIDGGKNVKEFSYEYIFSDDPQKQRKQKTGEELKNFTPEEITILRAVLEKNNFTMSYEKAQTDDVKVCKYCKLIDICGISMGGEKDE